MYNVVLKRRLYQMICRVVYLMHIIISKDTFIIVGGDCMIYELLTFNVIMPSDNKHST